MKKNTTGTASLRTKRIAVSSLLAALSFVFMMVGAVTNVLDLTAMMIASFCIVFAVIEIGEKWAWLIYGVCAVLSVLLLPSKSAALLYVLGGAYPIFKAWFEKYRAVIAWILKLSLFNTLQLLFILLAQKVLGLSGAGYEFVLTEILLGNVTFIVYDFALTVLLTAYLVRFRKRLRIKSLKE